MTFKVLALFVERLLNFVL